MRTLRIVMVLAIAVVTAIGMRDVYAEEKGSTTKESSSSQNSSGVISFQGHWTITPKGGAMVFKDGGWVPEKEVSGASGELHLEAYADGRKVAEFSYVVDGIDEHEGKSFYSIGSKRAFYVANENAYPVLTEANIKPSEEGTSYSASSVSDEAGWMMWCDTVNKEIEAQLNILKTGSDDEKMRALTQVGVLVHPAISEALELAAKDASVKVAKLAQEFIRDRSE